MIGREFIAVAIQLRTTNTDAAQRTRVGRAYYGAFLEARQFASVHLGMSAIRTAATHGAVASALASIDPQVQIDLGQLRRLRNVADYDLDLAQSLPGAQADQACVLAGSIIARLDRLDAQLRTQRNMARKDDLPSGLLTRDRDLALIEELMPLFPVARWERDAVSLVLLSYPHLPSMILRVLSAIQEMFPAARASLDTVAYDVWDPPVRLVYHIPSEPGSGYEQHHLLMNRLRTEDYFDPELLWVDVRWVSEAEGASRASEDQ